MSNGQTRAAYEDIPRTTPGPPPAPKPSVRERVSGWFESLLTVVGLAILVAVVIGAPLVIEAVNDNTQSNRDLSTDVQALTATVERVEAQQIAAKSRGCSVLAQEGGYFPVQCLEDDVLGLYARDIVDFLDRTGGEGDIRASLCRALEEAGEPDADCV